MFQNDFLKLAEKRILACKQCELHNDAIPALVGSGGVKSDIMFVSDAVGNSECNIGRAFMGKSNSVFEKALKTHGLTRQSVYATSCLKCSIESKSKVPEDLFKECAKHLFYQIELIQPKVICTMGPKSTKVILDEYRYKGQKEGMATLHGRPILITPKGRTVNHKRVNVPSFKLYLVPTFNPAAVDNFTIEQTIIDDVGSAVDIINLKSILF
jgi:DNA polymerase